MAVGHLAMTTKDGPMWCLSTTISQKGSSTCTVGLREEIEALRRDPRVCFWWTKRGPRFDGQRLRHQQIYESVMCFGRAEFVEGWKRSGGSWR